MHALAEAIGHQPPFSAEELAALEFLEVKHERDLRPLLGCTGLRRLRIVACELETVNGLKNMQLLEHLEIVATRMESLGDTIRCERLERIDILYSSVGDVADVLGQPSWNSGTIVANHCTEVGWHALAEDADGGRNLGELSSDYDWSTTQKAWERAEVCAGSIGDANSFVVRPGLPKLTTNDFDALRLMPSTLRHKMNQPGFSIERLFAERADRVEAPDLIQLANTRTLGKGDVAREWIARSPLSPDDQDRLTRFVDRFPHLVFYRWNDSVPEPDHMLPESYRVLRRTLAGWAPHRNSLVHFETFEEWSPRVDRMHGIQYLLGLSEHGNDGSEEALADFVIVGRSADGVTSTLAMRTDSGDPRVYEYDHEDILDAMSEGKDVTNSVYPVFASYAAMLSHVSIVDVGYNTWLAARQ